MAKNTDGFKYTVQEVLNWIFDRDANTIDVNVSTTASNSVTTISKALATKITESGSITYIAKALPGTAQASSLWQCQKIDETSGTVITWADGNANFDNVATDLTALTYS